MSLPVNWLVPHPLRSSAFAAIRKRTLSESGISGPPTAASKPKWSYLPATSCAKPWKVVVGSAVITLIEPPVAFRPYSVPCAPRRTRSEEHTSELQSLMRISYAVFCLKKKKDRSKYELKGVCDYNSTIMPVPYSTTHEVRQHHP